MIQVREYLLSEVERIAARAADNAWDGLTDWERRLADRAAADQRVRLIVEGILASPTGTALVAEIDGRFAGHVLLAVLPSDVTGLEEGRCFDVWVEPEFRRRGVAQTLNRAAAEHCRQHGAVRLVMSISVANAASQGSARKSGFTADWLIYGLPLQDNADAFKN